MSNSRLTDRESVSINIMKAVSILSVIAAHVVSLSDEGVLSKAISSFWDMFGRVGVVVFFILGGFLYSRKDGDTKSFWKKKLFRIIIPWLFCATGTYLYTVIWNSFSVGAYFKWIFGSGTWYYYIAVFTFFLFIFKWFYKKDVVLYCLMGVGCAALILATFGISTTPPLAFMTDYLNPLHWIGYFSAGILIRKHRTDLILQRRKIGVIVSGVVSITSLIILCVQEIHTYFNIITAIFCVSSTVVVAALSYRIAGASWGKHIGKIGTYSYCIYLLHMHIVQGVMRKIPNSIFEIIFAPFIGLAVMWLLVTAGMWICKKLPLGEKIIMLVGL